MDKETERALEDFNEMFNSDGWKRLIESLGEELDALKDYVFSLKDNNEFHYNRGKHDVIKRILQFEDYVEKTRELLEEDEEEDT